MVYKLSLTFYLNFKEEKVQLFAQIRTCSSTFDLACREIDSPGYQYVRANGQLKGDVQQ